MGWARDADMQLISGRRSLKLKRRNVSASAGRRAASQRSARGEDRAEHGPPLSSWSRAGALLLGFFAMGVLAYCLSSPVFAISTVKTGGQAVLTEEELVRGSAALDKNAFLLSEDSVTGAISRLATVKQVRSRIVLPDRVEVRVQEYQPRFLWQTASATYLVDERGVVLGTDRGGVALPKVREANGLVRERGDRVNLGALQNAARLYRLWPAGLGEAPVCEYSDGGLSFSLGSTRVELGDGSEVDSQVLALQAILRHADEEATEVAYMDLRVPGRPYYR